MEPSKQRRPHLWSWRAVRTMYRRQFPTMAEEELERKSREMAREMNNLDNRMRYDEWRFQEHEYASGLGVYERDDMNDYTQDH